jgi:hypothetical protein
MTTTQPLGPHTDYTVRLHDGWCVLTRRDHTRDTYRVTTIPPDGGRPETFEHPDLHECYAQLRVACGGRVPDEILRATEAVK